jgi:lipopolysaccharide transport system permease protein/teichoic acid transport system permease protein
MLKSFFYFIRLIILQKQLILSMARREVATQTVGSVLGFIWSFINPLVLIVVLWIVFSVGFRVQPKNGVPFVVWLTSGMAAWFIFAEIIGGSAGVVTANSHLIKKTLFHSQILPVIKIVSCLITHGIFLLVLLGAILLQGMPFSLYYLQFVYYLLCLVALGLGIGWIVAALNVFFRDVQQIVGVVIQIGFWATPIFWDIGIMPPRLQFLFKLNPMFYVVQGYRESFIYFSPFWRHPLQTAYFWGLTSLVFVMGALIFQRLKPHFADVL